MRTSPEPEAVVALVKDLMFGSKIAATARAAGRVVTMVRAPVQLTGKPGGMLLVDLSIEGAIEAAAAWKRQANGQVIGFVSHVDSETIAAARAAGLDQVLARSAFAAQLESLLGSS